MTSIILLTKKDFHYGGNIEVYTIEDKRRYYRTANNMVGSHNYRYEDLCCGYIMLKIKDII